MGFSLKFHCCLMSVMVFLPTLCCAQDYVKSRATYYGSPDCLGTPRGACGYGEFGRTVNDANVAGVSYRLYKNGTGCGTCYQADCKEWIGMRRAYGAVFDTTYPRSGAVTLRFQVQGRAGVYWVQASNVIPSDWKAGVAYESDIELE